MSLLHAMLDSPASRLARREKKPHLPREWMTMLATVEAYPNVDVMVFYVVGAVILALTLYR